MSIQPRLDAAKGRYFQLMQQLEKMDVARQNLLQEAFRLEGVIGVLESIMKEQGDAQIPSAQLSSVDVLQPQGATSNNGEDPTK